MIYHASGIVLRRCEFKALSARCRVPRRLCMGAGKRVLSASGLTRGW
jgi:hypothetical protein